MKRLNEVMDLKFSLLIFRQFHAAITRSQKKNLYAHLYIMGLSLTVSEINGDFDR